MSRHPFLSVGLLLLAGACASNSSTPGPVSSVEGSALCAEAANTAKPWVGDWSARTGEATVRMNIAGKKVRGNLTTSVTTFAFTGGVSDTGYINITLAGNDHWDRAEMGGKFPVVLLSSGSDGRSFETIDGFQFRLCA